MLSIFLCAYLLSICHLVCVCVWNVYASILPIFLNDWFFSFLLNFENFYILWIKVLCLICDLLIFSPSLWLVFFADCLNFEEEQLLNFFCKHRAFISSLRELWKLPLSHIFLQKFYDLGLRFKSTLYFELISDYYARCGWKFFFFFFLFIFFLYIAIPLFQPHLLKRQSRLYWITFTLLSKNNGAYRCRPMHGPCILFYQSEIFFKDFISCSLGLLAMSYFSFFNLKMSVLCVNFWKIFVGYSILCMFACLRSLGSLQILPYCLLAYIMPSRKSAVFASLQCNATFFLTVLNFLSLSLILNILIIMCLESLRLWTSCISGFKVFLTFWKLSDKLSNKIIRQKQFSPNSFSPLFWGLQIHIY